MVEGLHMADGKGHDDAQHRRSTRLRAWDYASPGAYFVTICTQDRVPLFGDVRDGRMHLHEPGMIVATAWQWLPTQYSHVILDEWCVMPNHLHGILVIRRGGSRTAPGGSRTAPTGEGDTGAKPIGRLIGAFKTVSTKQINLARPTPGEPVWQRNYWDHIIREGEDIDRIRVYIRDNPPEWSADELNAKM
jgi:putative transposase